jgi:protein O-mannosyl-transferase
MKDMPLGPFCEKHRILLLSAALVVLTFAAFEGLRRNDFVKFDDPEYITENTRIQSGLTLDSIVWAFKSGEAANWHPLTWISHMVDIQLFGLNPAGHHLHNLALHILATVLLFWVLSGMTGAVWRSAFVAMAFAIHPVHVESVAWGAERKDVLCAVFWMLTMAAYLSYARRGGVFRYLLVVVCFALGLMAKPMIITLPIVLLALDLWPLGRWSRGVAGRIALKTDPKTAPKATAKTASQTCRPASPARLILEKIPLFALTLTSCAITFLVQRSGGAVAGLDVPISFRLANAVLSYGRYLGKLVLPINLAVIYPLPPEGWPFWMPLVSALVLIAITALVLYGSRKRPYLIAGWIWYVVTLVPVIGLVQVGSQAMADRYTYLPSIGILIMAAWGAADLSAKWPHRNPAWAVAGGVLGILMIVGTHIQTSYWKDGATLYGHTLAVTRNNYALHCCLGTVLEDQGKLDEAEQQYRESMRICPTFTEAHLCLGQVFELRGQYADAVGCYEQARQLNAADFRVPFKVAEAQTKIGALADAASNYQQSLRMNPGFAKAYVGLGQVLAAQQKYSEAMQAYDQAMRLDPTDPGLYYRIGAVWAQQGVLDKAAESMRQSLRMNPNLTEAYIALGIVFQKLGRPDEAINQFRMAVKVKPDSAEAWSNLGDCYQGQGKLPEAVDAYTRSIRARPNGAATYSKLGEVLKQQGRVKEAVAQHRQAVQIDPEFAPSLNNLAWILATNKDAEIRNPTGAVQFAEKVCQLTGFKDQNCLDTLGAAYAAAGQFDKAVETTQKAIALAQAAGDNAGVQDILQKQKLYQARQPYIEP